MRKVLWVVVLVVGAVSAPNAQADGVDASFTCTTSCVDVPLDPPVSFPSPIIPIDFFNQSFTITLDASDQLGDTYTWGVGSNSTGWYFIINDLTNGISDSGASFALGGSGTPYGGGNVYFTNAPEPSSITLMLFGLGALLLGWKLKGYRYGQVT